MTSSSEVGGERR